MEREREILAVFIFFALPQKNRVKHFLKNNLFFLELFGLWESGWTGGGRVESPRFFRAFFYSILPSSSGSRIQNTLFSKRNYLMLTKLKEKFKIKILLKTF